MHGVAAPKVDVVLLSRGCGPLRLEVEEGIHAQKGVEVILHRVIGEPRPNDRCRWETIARARNAGKQLGSSPWLMFLDDDVVLAPDCIATLSKALAMRPLYAALAADYSDQQHAGQIAGHVSMGATLFRRKALDQIEFRWTDHRCECQCCCDDLRRMFWAIDYLPSARAIHRPLRDHVEEEVEPRPERVLAGDRSSSGEPSLCLVVCYFGPLPGWFDYYLRSCAHNPTIDFILFSDRDDLPELPRNVRVVKLTRDGFNHLATRKLGFEVSLSHSRKLCDFKPLYGHLFEEHLTDCDYWGYTDLDVIYGDLRRHLTEARLAGYDVFTARREFLVGHFTLFRNTDMMRRLYTESRDLQETLAAPQVRSFDECGKEWWTRLQGGSCSSTQSCDSMSHVINRLREDRKLRVCFAHRVLEWPELGMVNWRVRWKAGRLELANPWREAMYCHFHAFKHQLGYKLPPYLGDESCFELTAVGIGPPASSCQEKIGRELLPAL